ncbi:hypothetical protein AN958_06811 [Leucoagaricus sp. SymC.cos]|nr:hypothetical protein AN958_06811 [Leucoagaricus sp. SymC.cos]
MAHLGGLQFNPSTNEPFLRLRKHPNIIITPPRSTDVPFIVPLLNDQRVHVWLLSPPYPYNEEHARQFIDAVKPNCDQSLEHFLRATQLGVEGPAIYMTHSPVRFLREIQEDGSDIFIGDIELDRCSQVEVFLENPKVRNAENLRLPAGCSDTVWTIGYFLAPSHHGRGIMTDALESLVSELGKPLLGIRHIVATTFFGNEGSMKVFLKNGFSLKRHLVDHVEAKGKLQSLNVFERHFID